MPRINRKKLRDIFLDQPLEARVRPPRSRARGDTTGIKGASEAGLRARFGGQRFATGNTTTPNQQTRGIDPLADLQGLSKNKIPWIWIGVAAVGAYMLFGKKK